MKKVTEAFLWLILVASFFGWGFDFLLLAVSAGSPHLEGSGWSQARIEDYTHDVHVATLLFYSLPVLFFSDVIGLWLIRRRVNIA